MLTALRAYAVSAQVQRVSGADRYATAAALASYYPVGVPRVYLASGENFPDALSVAALAGRQGVPLLLTRSDRLDAATTEQLARLDPGEVVVVGGSTTVQDSVAQQAAGFATSGTYRRLSGASRYATAAAVAEEFPSPSSQVYVAVGTTFPDALAGAALAGRRGVPLVLTPPHRVDAGTARALRDADPAAMFVLGGTSTIPDSTVDLLAAYLR